MSATGFDLARKIADAVLYEGYVLYPYRASAAKNQIRFQFGVVAPQAFSEATGSDPWSMQNECVVELPVESARLLLDVRIRFLQVQARSIEAATGPGTFERVERLDVGSETLISWDEGVAREIDLPTVDVLELVDGEKIFPVSCAAGRQHDFAADTDGRIRGRIVRELSTIDGTARLCASRIEGGVKIRVRLQNGGDWASTDSDDRTLALRHSYVGAHFLLGVTGGSFVSPIDPPDWAMPAVACCQNLHAWPVLVGPHGSRDMMLVAPIILPDYPEIAPESPGDLCDGTEIDELLTLCVMTMTDDEKREARATDERSRQIVDRADVLPDAMRDRLHGAVRYLQDSRPAAAPPAPPDLHFDLFEAPSSEDDWFDVGAVRVTKGSRVRLHPRPHADVMDMFLDGRTGCVQGVFRDFDDRTYAAVTIDDDPGADLHCAQGRFFYFFPEEIEPLAAEPERGANE